MADHVFCKAKTRSGSPCRRPAGWGTAHVGEGRCKLHGGCSLRGQAHPRFKHGRYARYEVVVMSNQIREQHTMISDGEVFFDVNGKCAGLTGLVQAGQLQRFTTPQPLRAKDLAAFRKVPGFTVTVIEHPLPSIEPSETK